jgi:hypothetical protein
MALYAKWRLKFVEELWRRIMVKCIFQNGCNILKELMLLLIVGIPFASCISFPNSSTDDGLVSTSTDGVIVSNEVVISETTTYQTALSKSDVAKYFCYNLTEYFNTYKYYKITSEVFSEKENQNYNSTSKITKQISLRRIIYNVEYIGSSGKYSISFSNEKIPESDEILTFGRRTVLGNAIRNKVYDTFCAWFYRMEIALKSNDNSDL